MGLHCLRAIEAFEQDRCEEGRHHNHEKERAVFAERDDLMGAADAREDQADLAALLPYILDKAFKGEL